MNDTRTATEIAEALYAGHDDEYVDECAWTYATVYNHALMSGGGPDLHHGLISLHLVALEINRRRG